jgi:hypothetical protein
MEYREIPMSFHRLDPLIILNKKNIKYYIIFFFFYTILGIIPGSIRITANIKI